MKRRDWREAGSGEQSDGEGGFTPRPRSAIGWSGSARDIHYNKRYTWDEETHSYIPISTASSTSSGRPSSSTRPPAQRYASAPLNQMSRKHVSFENSILNRSSTASSFEETKLRRAVMIIGGSVERLLEAGGRADACTGVAHKTVEAQSSQTILKRLTRTQSTQTDTFIVRASGPPPYLSLSPRTSYRVSAYTYKYTLYKLIIKILKFLTALFQIQKIEFTYLVQNSRFEWCPKVHKLMAVSQRQRLK